MTRFITHFESAIDGTVFPADQLQTWHAKRPLWSRYDLDQIRQAVTPEIIASRPANMWRYRELLPIGDEIEPISLDEAMTPMVNCPRFARSLNLQHVFVKDESRLATCSFKARGLSLALTMARHFGVRRVAMASNGNAGGAMAIYAARGDMDAFVLVPKNTPITNIAECVQSGAVIYYGNGLIDECGRLIREGHDRKLWFDISTMKEPYRLEGKKTMGLELAEQFQWELPDVILYPTGGGTALIAMWKAFQELRELGWLKSSKMPRMISVQSTGCPPLVLAYEKGERFVTRFENTQTIASGLRVPQGIGDFMVLDAVRESCGMVIAADESQLFAWQKMLASHEGVMVCPETSTCIGALVELAGRGEIKSTDKVVIFNTAAGQKYMDYFRPDLPELDLSQFDWATVESRLKRPAYDF
ncbi:MAG: threonine synthase [Pirellulaceae bacterium]|jgi:threonine synthase|nr:threonine synthase [Pirellulaceae bacterium]